MKNYFQLKYEEEKNKTRKEYNQRLVELTLKYQKQYRFELNYKKGHEHLTWNCEADAFKHAFGSILIAMEKGVIYSKFAGIMHELDNPHNPIDEKNMDLHNNDVGLNIAKNLKNAYKEKWNNLTRQQQEDIIAKKVIEKMNAGELILDPSGRRMPRHKLINHSSNKKGCAGTYHVNGYKRADGTEVSDYYRTCGARHKSLDGVDIRFAAENLSDDEIKAGRAKYAGKKFQDLTPEEVQDAIRYFV